MTMSADSSPTVIKNLYDLYKLLDLPIPPSALQQQPNEDPLDAPLSSHTEEEQINLDKLFHELVPDARVRSNKMTDRYKAWKFVQRFNNINEMQQCRRNHGVNKAGRNKAQSKSSTNCKKNWYHCKHSSCSYRMMSIETTDGCELYEHGEHNHPFKPTRGPMLSLAHEMPVTPGWMLDIWKNLDKFQPERIITENDPSTKVVKEEAQIPRVDETPMAMLLSALSNQLPEFTSTTPSPANALADVPNSNDIEQDQIMRSQLQHCKTIKAGPLTFVHINNLNLIAYKYGVLLTLDSDKNATFSFKKDNKKLTFEINEKEVNVICSTYGCIEQCESLLLASWDIYFELIETKCAALFTP